MTCSSGLVSDTERISSLATRLEQHALGCKTVWRRIGSGPPLVLLHGGHGSWMHWVRNIEALSSNRTVWIPDLPGYGESQSIGVKHGDKDRLQRLVATLAASVDQLVGRDVPFDLCGFSFGGFVAAHLAARMPVCRLALIGASGHGGTRRQSKALGDWRQLSEPERRAVLRSNLESLMIHDPGCIDHALVSMYEKQCREARFHSRSLTRSAGLLETLNVFNGPIMFIWGEHDVTATPDDLEPLLMRGRSQATWHVVQGAGHWAQYERSSAVNLLLSAWCAGT